LLKNGANFGLDLCFRLACLRPVAIDVQPSNAAVNGDSLSHRSLGWLLDKIDIKDPPLERHSRVFGYNRYNELRHRPCKQPRCMAR
jgi:hypothetical protein